MAGTPWQITVLSPLSVALQLAASRAWVTGALIALMLLLGALLYQRRRHVREQLAAQQALKLSSGEEVRVLLSSLGSGVGGSESKEQSHGS